MKDQKFFVILNCIGAIAVLVLLVLKVFIPIING